MMWSEAGRPVCVLGTGSVGIAAMVGLAELGWVVNGCETASDRPARSRAGSVATSGADLAEAFERHRASGRLTIHASLKDAASRCEVIIIAMGTADRDDARVDPAALLEAVEALRALRLNSWPTIVIRATVPPGTCDALAARVAGWGELIYAPAFVGDASPYEDFLHPDRIVIGCESAAAAVHYVRLLESIGAPLVLTSRSSAELMEFALKAFLAMKASFADEIAARCEAVGACADDVLRGIGYDRRIGEHGLVPGIGFGDGAALRDDTGGELLPATLRVDAAQPQRIVALIEGAAGRLEGATIGVWGCSARRGNDDVRDARATRVIELLADRGADVLVYDPAIHVIDLPAGCRLVRDALDAALADVLVVLTDRPEFRATPPHSYAPLIRRRIVIDGRNVLDPERVASAGLAYRGLGRTAAAAPLAFSPAFAL